MNVLLFLLLIFCEFFVCKIKSRIPIPPVDGSNVNDLINQIDFVKEFYFELLSPSDIAYTYRMRLAKNFGPIPTYFHKKIGLVIVDPIEACGGLHNAEELSNRVALVKRGECSFVTKALTVEAAGAVSLIVMDNDASNDDRMVDMIDDDTRRDVTIPTYFIMGKDGSMIERSLHRHGLPYAVINIPYNATVVSLKQPPWNIWS